MDPTDTLQRHCTICRTGRVIGKFNMIYKGSVSSNNISEG